MGSKRRSNRITKQVRDKRRRHKTAQSERRQFSRLCDQREALYERLRKGIPIADSKIGDAVSQSAATAFDVLQTVEAIRQIEERLYKEFNVDPHIISPYREYGSLVGTGSWNQGEGDVGVRRDDGNDPRANPYGLPGWCFNAAPTLTHFRVGPGSPSSDSELALPASCGMEEDTVRPSGAD